jgi:hypothetical protein
MEEKKKAHPKSVFYENKTFLLDGKRYCTMGYLVYIGVWDISERTIKKHVYNHDLGTKFLDTRILDWEDIQVINNKVLGNKLSDRELSTITKMRTGRGGKKKE